jgi:8-oxo-dGTP pyrophosphatase MutT (NUDIX family)
MTTTGRTDYIALSRDMLQSFEPRRLHAPDAMPSAVLVPLIHHAGQDRVVLTVRSYDVEHHKGQISFPGGAVHDADADLQTTALRETWEEIGVVPDDVEVIGQLNDQMTISNFVVTPFVGVLRRSPYEYVPSAIEVAEVIEPPISHLLETVEWERRDLADRTVYMPNYYFQGHRVFGATALMLLQLLRLIAGTAAEPPAPQ